MKTELSACPVRIATEREFQRAVKEYGMFVTPAMAAFRAGCRREHIYHLIEDGYFRKFVLFGAVHISEAAFIDWWAKRQMHGLCTDGPV